MASIVSAGTTSATALNMSADTSGVLQLASNNGTVGLTMNTSQNIGIGTASPASDARLTIASPNTESYVMFSRTNSGVFDAAIGNNGGSIVFRGGADSSTVAGLTEFMRLDSTGNLGLGVTAGAWASGQGAMQFKNGGLSAWALGGINGYIYSNAVYDGTNNRYINTGTAASYAINNATGGHLWFTAPSGTAGNAITFTQAMTLTAGGNLGVGNTSPDSRLVVEGSSGTYAQIKDGTVNLFLQARSADSTGVVGTITNHGLAFYTNSTEKARIDSSGNLLVGTTSAPQAYPTRIAFAGSLAGAGIYSFNSSAGADASFLSKVTNTNCFLVYFDYNNTNVGGIKTNGTSTSYNTTSDYRLKENIAPMTGALATVAQLKPCTYTWKSNGSSGQGFIAHELQSVVQDAVSGEKDGVKEDGTPIYQGVDSSFLVATLTAAIQEQQAIIDQLKADVTALKGAA
jgi:hypothetical protein